MKSAFHESSMADGATCTDLEIHLTVSWADDANH